MTRSLYWYQGICLCKLRHFGGNLFFYKHVLFVQKLYHQLVLSTEELCYSNQFIIIISEMKSDFCVSVDFIQKLDPLNSDFIQRVFIMLWTNARAIWRILLIFQHDHTSHVEFVTCRRNKSSFFLLKYRQGHVAILIL